MRNFHWINIYIMHGYVAFNRIVYYPEIISGNSFHPPGNKLSVFKDLLSPVDYDNSFRNCAILNN